MKTTQIEVSLLLLLTFSVTAAAYLQAQNQNFDGVAELPRTKVDTKFPARNGRVVTVGAGDNLQSRLNSLNCGDTAVLQAGASWTGNFKLPYKPCDDQHWIVIQSSALDKLPPEGTRVKPTDSASMARLLTPNSQPAIDTGQSGGQDQPVNHYRLAGIEIGAIWDTRNPTRGSDSEVYIVANFGAGGTSADKYPHHIVVDRCYIHGGKANEVRHGVRFTANNFAVVDSYIADIHRAGRDSTAISSDFAQGPIKIVNNYLEAAGENILFGGTDPQVQGSVPSDIEVRQNYFYKPLSWKQGSPSYLGIRWTLKNLFECKNCRRVLLEGNVFANQWAGDQASAIVLTPRNANGRCEWCIVADVTFRFNRVSHAAGFMGILGADAKSAGGSLGPSQPSQRINVHDNVIEDINNREWGGGDYSNGKVIMIVMGTGQPKIDKVSFVHNTFSGNTKACNSLITFATNSTTAKMTNLVIKDNIFPACSYSIAGDYGSDRNALGNAAPGSYTFTNNVFVGWDATGISGDLFLPKNAKVGDYPALKFENYNGGVGGNYRLSGRSPFRNKASDGKDIGANINLVENYTAAALAGKARVEVARRDPPIISSKPAAVKIPLDPPDSNAISVKNEVDEIGNKIVKVQFPGHFALQLSDGSKAVAGPTSTGLNGYWDLKTDPGMRYNLAGGDAGLLSKDFGYEGMFEAKPSGGRVRVLEQNNVRVVLEFTWPVRAYGNNGKPVDSSLTGKEVWTVYRPGKIYERFSFSNNTPSEIRLKYLQYGLHTTWTRFDGEGSTYDSPYWQKPDGYIPRVASPWGFVADTKTPVSWILHSVARGSTTPETPSPRYGLITTLAGQNVPVRTNFLEVLAEDSGHYAYAGQLFVGMRSKIEVDATVPQGKESWVRHLLLIAGDKISDEAGARKHANGYRTPPKLKITSPSTVIFDFDAGCYQIQANRDSVDMVAEGYLYFPCFDIQPWTQEVPSSISLNGVKSPPDKIVTAKMNGRLLVQMQQEVEPGTRITLP